MYLFSVIVTMLGEVQNKLKTVYKHVCYSDNPHYYIQLALVREEIRNIRDQRLNEITRHTLQGQVDEILKIKEPLKRGLEDIFHHKDLPCPVPRLILILGAPGMYIVGHSILTLSLMNILLILGYDSVLSLHTLIHKPEDAVVIRHTVVCRRPRKPSLL